MRLATLTSPAGPRLALFHRAAGGPRWVDFAQGVSLLLGEGDAPPDLKGLLARDGAKLATARRLEEALARKDAPDGVRTWDPRTATYLPPVPEPGAFLDFYAFEEHVRNARARRGLEVPPEWYRHPVYYRSNPRGLLGHGAQVTFPKGEGKMDYELELAAVLGDPLESPTPEAAAAAVAGYCLLNDWSARALQREVMAVGLGPNKGKDFATSAGPWMVTPDELGDLSALVLEARVNGEVRSRGVFGAIRWSWGDMLAYAAEGVRFEPGDLFGSGTLGNGCGLEQDRFLQEGDRVELDGGEALGVLAGTVRAGGAA